MSTTIPQLSFWQGQQLKARPHLYFRVKQVNFWKLFFFLFSNYRAQGIPTLELERQFLNDQAGWKKNCLQLKIYLQHLNFSKKTWKVTSQKNIILVISHYKLQNHKNWGFLKYTVSVKKDIMVNTLDCKSSTTSSCNTLHISSQAIT